MVRISAGATCLVLAIGAAVPRVVAQATTGRYFVIHLTPGVAKGSCWGQKYQVGDVVRELRKGCAVRSDLSPRR